MKRTYALMVSLALLLATPGLASADPYQRPAGNQKFDKERGNARGPVRIDPAVAVVMALGVAGTVKPEPKVESYYEQAARTRASLVSHPDSRPEVEV